MLVCRHASAGLVMPTNYDMLNGESGYWGSIGQGGYWDRTYSGAGNPLQDLSPLSGGLGQLTDGDLGGIPTPDMNYTHGWVGWQQNNDNPGDPANFKPSITFNFAAPQTFDQLSFYVDNSGLGDVYVFGTVTLSFSDDGVTCGDPITYQTTAEERADSGAEWINVPLTAAAESIRADFAYQTGVTQDPRGPWIFLSEVRFDSPLAQSVPEPASAVFWGLLTGCLALWRLCGSLAYRIAAWPTMQSYIAS